MGNTSVGICVGVGDSEGVSMAVGVEVMIIAVGVSVLRLVGVGVRVLLRVAVGLIHGEGVRVSVKVGEGVNVIVKATVGDGVRENTGVSEGMTEAGETVAVPVAVGTVITSDCGIRLPGADQIAGLFTSTEGAGRIGLFWRGATNRYGKIRNRLMLASPCARVTPSKERVCSTTTLNTSATRNTKIKSSQERYPICNIVNMSETYSGPALL